MKKIYDCSTSAVIDSLAGDSHKRTYKCCYKRLREYLSYKGAEYSHSLAIEWLETERSRWPAYCYSTYRTALYRLNEMVNTGCLSTSKRMFPYNDSPKYARLSDWSRCLLDDSLKTTSYYGNSKNLYRIAVAEFLFYLEENGVTRFEEITMSGFRQYLIFLKTIWQKHDVYRDRVNYTFSFMAYISNGCISEIINNYMANSKLPIVEEMEMRQIESINNAIEADKASAQSIENIYDWVVGNFHAKEKTITKSSSSRYKAKWMSFLLFIVVNEIQFSLEIAKCWCDIVNIPKLPFLHKEKDYGTKHYTLCFSKAVNTPEVKLPEWSKSLLLGYLAAEKNNGKAENTLTVMKYACIKFLTYLEQQSIDSCREITPQVLNDFNNWDKHKTNEGKKGTNSRIHRFLKYLGETGRVPRTLCLALPCKFAVQERIVKILDETQIKKLYLAKEEASSPIELRDSAIVFIGFRMGLRAGDIVTLAFKDIDWQKNIIHIQQNKTGKSVTLPMPIEVGNCIYKYIQNGRPNIDSEVIFVSHKPPYSSLSSRGCADGLNRMLRTMKNGKKKYGFHITRKTFASRILQSGNEAEKIANLLGHDGNHTVMKYLAMDSSKMRMCSISASKVVANND